VLSADLRDLAEQNTEREILMLELQADHDVAAELGGQPGVERVEAMPGSDGGRRYRLACARGGDLRPRLAAFVVGQGWGLVELRPQETSLEEIYLKVVSSEGAAA
jgi:hypothetical protein